MPLPARHLDARGFTLLEMLLVLAILVVVAGLATFPIKSFLEQQTLQQEAERIRIRWGKTRNEAMRTGRIYVFQFKPGDAAYRTHVWMSADDELEATGPLEGELTDPSLTAANPAPRINSVAGEAQLADGLSFVGAETLDDRAAVLTADENQRALEEWSPPILFYPDGTTSTARVIIADQRQRAVQLDLRGLTGISRISPANPEAEVVR